MTNEAVVREVYAALNRNDIPSLTQYFDPQIERIEPEGFPMSGTYLGRDKVLAHFSLARDTWAEGSCEIEKVMLAGDKVLVSVTVHVRLKNREDWIDGKVFDGFKFRNGKIVSMRTFVEKSQALVWTEK